MIEPVVENSDCVQFGKDFAESKYDWRQEGRQQLLLPSEYKKAVAAKAAAPVISWHPKIISSCWKISCRYSYFPFYSCNLVFHPCIVRTPVSCNHLKVLCKNAYYYVTCAKDVNMCRLVVKLDEEKNVRREFMEWVDAEATAAVAAAATAGKSDSKASDVRSFLLDSRCLLLSLLLSRC